jgi:hypothetical protein
MANETEDSGIVWDGANYPRVPPGIYQASCIGWQGPDQCRAFRLRWSIRLEFSLLADGQFLSGFFNLGTGAKPKVGRRSRIFKVWAMANGETPRKGQRMTWDTFTEAGLIYTVQVADALTDGNQKQKPDAMVYSKVTEVLGVDRP